MLRHQPHAPGSYFTRHFIAWIPVFSLFVFFFLMDCPLREHRNKAKIHVKRNLNWWLVSIYTCTVAIETIAAKCLGLLLTYRTSFGGVLKPGLISLKGNILCNTRTVWHLLVEGGEEKTKTKQATCEREEHWARVNYTRLAWLFTSGAIKKWGRQERGETPPPTPKKKLFI